MELRPDGEGDLMLSEVACLVGGKDLKLYVIDSFWESGLGFE